MMTMNKYFIGYVLEGKEKEYNQKLVEEVGPMFGEDYIVENPRPPHLTLKSPFETDKIEEIESLLSKFAKDHKSTRFKINGFDNFRKFVAFLKVEDSDKIRELQKSLINELKKISWIKIDKYDLEWKPHATIAYGNTQESFNKIWNYLQNLQKPEFDIQFKKISLLKKENNLWKIYKEYELNN